MLINHADWSLVIVKTTVDVFAYLFLYMYFSTTDLLLIPFNKSKFSKFDFIHFFFPFYMEIIYLIKGSNPFNFSQIPEF